MANTTDYFSFTAVSLFFAFVIVIFTAYNMGIFPSKNKFDVNGKTLLLTGASEGMGKSVAEILASRGANIVIVARNIGKLEKAIADISSHASNQTTQRFTHISSDVTKPGEALRIFEETKKWNNGSTPDIVWCMAGSAKPQLFLDSSLEDMRQQMDVNYWSCAELAHAVLGDWLSPDTLKEGKKRHLIFTSSVVAFYTIAGYATYSPTKIAIRSLADSLAQEVLLYTKDVKIHTIFPGTIDSAGLSTENQTKAEITHILEADDPVQTPEIVARKSIRGLEKGHEQVAVHLLGDAMRVGVMGGSGRNNWVIDTLLLWVVSIAWVFIRMDLNGKVVSYGKKHGHPSTNANSK